MAGKWRADRPGCRKSRVKERVFLVSQGFMANPGAPGCYSGALAGNSWPCRGRLLDKWGLAAEGLTHAISLAQEGSKGDHTTARDCRCQRDQWSHWPKVGPGPGVGQRTREGPQLERKGIRENTTQDEDGWGYAISGEKGLRKKGPREREEGQETANPRVLPCYTHTLLTGK